MTRAIKRDLRDEEVKEADEHVDYRGLSDFYNRYWSWKAMGEPLGDDVAMTIRILIDKLEEYTWLNRLQTSPSGEGRLLVIAGSYRDVQTSLAMISSHMAYLPLMEEIDNEWEGLV